MQSPATPPPRTTTLKDTKQRRERKPATLSVLKRLAQGQLPLERPDLRSTWQRITATLQGRIDYLTWPGRSTSYDTPSVLADIKAQAMMQRWGMVETDRERHDELIAAIDRVLGTLHDPDTESPDLTDAERERLRGRYPIWNAHQKRYERNDSDGAAKLLEEIENTAWSVLYAEQARRRLVERYRGRRDRDTGEWLDGAREGNALRKESNERDGKLATPLERRLTKLASNARRRGDLPARFLTMVKAADQRRRSA
jgi:hypothetical protein